MFTYIALRAGRCALQTGPGFSLGRSSSPRSRTLVCSHAAVVCPFNGLRRIFYAVMFVLLIACLKSVTRLIFLTLFSDFVGEIGWESFKPLLV